MRSTSKLPALKIYTLLVLVTACFVVFYFLAKRDIIESKATLESQENRFHLQFNIAKEDEENFQKLLQNSLLPQDIKNGLFFELDATSSAALAFESPLEVNLKVTPKSLMAEGVLRTILQKPSQGVKNCKIPQNSPLSVYGTNLINLLPKVISLPAEIKEWTTSNFQAKDSQCFVIINNTDDFIILTQDSQVDLESLKDLVISQKENVYKKESRDLVDLHLLKVQDEEAGGEEITLVFFKTGDFSALSTSIEAVDDFIKQDKKGDLKAFPQTLNQEPPIFQASFQNHSNSEDQEKLLNLFFKNQNDLKKFQTTVQNAEFTLTKDRFSVLINLK